MTCRETWILFTGWPHEGDALVGGIFWPVSPTVTDTGCVRGVFQGGPPPYLVRTQLWRYLAVTVLPGLAHRNVGVLNAPGKRLKLWALVTWERDPRKRKLPDPNPVLASDSFVTSAQLGIANPSIGTVLLPNFKLRILISCRNSDKSF